jgi:DNA-binding MurR/RpiR family transcriptional regulator
MERATGGRTASEAIDTRLKDAALSMGPAGRRIVSYIDHNRAKALAMSALEIAASTRTSDATVIRTVQSLGYAGLGPFKQALAGAVERPTTPADDMRRTLAEIGTSAGDAIDLVLAAHEEAIAVLRAAQAKAQIAAAVGALHAAERIAVFGIGPSSALAAYASIMLGRGGRRALTLDQTGIRLADQLLDLRPGDAILAIAYSRISREVATLVDEARRLRMPIVLMSDVLGTKLGHLADVVVAIPRGRTERVALHGGTFVALEALLLGLVSLNAAAAMSTLDRLNALRNAVSGQSNDLGS